MDYYNPLEDDECITFSQWLRLNHIPHAHIANESRSSSRNAIIRGAKLKKMGQSKGVWDYEIYCPNLIKVEMKRRKGGVVSEEQKKWGEIYEKANIPHKVCRGADEAIDFVKSFLK